MKNIKLRIVYLILCSALLLFALFMLAVNLIIPAHFVREAKKALISEAQYQNRTIPYTDDGSFFDDEWNDTEEHFLTPSIVFLELDNANQSSGWNRDAYRLEKKLLEYCKGRELSLNQCYTFKTDKHHLIFMSVQEELTAKCIRTVKYLTDAAEEHFGSEGLCAIALGLRALVEPTAAMMRHYADATLSKDIEEFAAQNLPVSLDTAKDDLWTVYGDERSRELFLANFSVRLKRALSLEA